MFGNVGRYYLALPPSVAIRAASASTFTNEYFNYIGVDANGVPTGLTSLHPGPVSTGGAYGQTPDPKTVPSSSLKAHYQDEYILGADHQFNQNWVSGIGANIATCAQRSRTSATQTG